MATLNDPATTDAVGVSAGDKAGDDTEVLVVVITPAGPLHVYIGAPSPTPVGVALSVKLPPTHNVLTDGVTETVGFG